jgi:hypothetical protein
MTEPQPSHWTHRRQAYAMIVARWAGDDAAMDALPPEHRMPVIRALIDSIDTQRRLTEQSRRDFLDDYAAEINAAHAIERLGADAVEHLARDDGVSERP